MDMTEAVRCLVVCEELLQWHKRRCSQFIGIHESGAWGEDELLRELRTLTEATVTRLRRATNFHQLDASYHESLRAR